MPNQKDILQAIADYLGLAAEDIDRQTSLRDDLGFGPIELNDLLNELSNRFNVAFNPEDTENLKTIDDLIVLIEDNLLE